MRRIIINSEVNAKALALLCAHIENVQMTSIIITDCLEMLHYGEKHNVADSTLNELELKPTHVASLDDVLMIVYPELANIKDSTEFINTLDKLEKLAESLTMQVTEASVVYLGGTVYELSMLNAVNEKTESTLVDLRLYRETLKITQEFEWAEGEEKLTATDTSKAYIYTCIYNKKDAKKAAKLKNPVITINPNDILSVLESEKTGRWKIKGTWRTLATELIVNHLSIPQSSIDAWLTTDANKE